VFAWIMGQEGSRYVSSVLAARAPDRKVGPRLIVILENLRRKKKLSTMSEIFWSFSSSPLFIPGKLPSLLTEGIPGYLMGKNAVGVSKNIPLTTEGIIRRTLGHFPTES
jgi:hypothetical protein